MAPPLLFVLYYTGKLPPCSCTHVYQSVKAIIHHSYAIVRALIEPIMTGISLFSYYQISTPSPEDICLSLSQIQYPDATALDLLQSGYNGKRDYCAFVRHASKGKDL